MFFSLLPLRSFNPLCRAGALLLALVASSPAQDRTLLYNVADPGVSKAIPTWGLDTAWLSDVNVRRGVIFMGQPQVDVIRFSFTADRPLTNDTLNASAMAEFNDRMNIVNAYTAPGTGLYLNNDSDFIDPYYKNGSQTIATNWAKLINATRQQCEAAGRTVLSVSPFNEPDFGTAQGDIAKLGEICWYIRTNSVFGSNFTNIKLCGGSTLNNDVAAAWYNPLSAVLDQGCTHQLAGGFDSYAAFFQTVQANGDVGVNDELHNVMEAMVGVEYGMQVGIWWGSAERARGEFVKASDGQRLGYAEHRPNWTAASVYRAPGGRVQAFVGESERQALPTAYRFFSKDRDVFYDGHGPQRAFDVATTGGAGYQTVNHRNAERVVNINWGADVQPVINGRYIIVARHSLKAIEVAGSSTNDGANIQQNTYSGGLNQQWDVTPMPSSSGGDYSYFSLTAAHSGKAPDVFNFSFNDGGDVRQWGLPGSFSGVNQQWYLEYVTNGWFHIRSRWSGKYLDVAGISTSDGANIHQWSGTGGLNQQWRFIPVGASPTDVTAPAQITGVNAAANPRSVQLTWNASTAPDLGGYTVLRSTTNGGPYDIVARGLTNNAFTDKSANLPQAYYYVVRAVDRSWNSSASSAQVSATPSGAPAVIASYPFNGTLSDSSANANHPIVTNGSPTFVAGQNGSAWDFNGTNHYAMLPANKLAGVTNFTIALWVNWDGGGNWQRIFDFGNGTLENMFLTPSSGSGTLRFAITTNGGGAELQLNAPALPTNQWRHVAITRDGNVGRLYTNGVLAATNLMTLSPASFNPVLNYLGKSQYPDPLFNGRLDDLFVYNYALTGPEILALAYPVPAAPASLAAVAGNNWVGLSWNAVSNATGYNVKRSTTNGGPYGVIASPTATNYTDTTAANGTLYYYVVSALTPGGESTNSIQASATPFTPEKLAGAVIGSPGSFGGLGNTVSNAFDGSTNTFYDAANASGDWAGLDLGTAKVITQIRYAPRALWASRMVGGVFQGANVADFSSGAVTLFAVTATPPEGVLTTQAITNLGSYRYVRYLGPANGFCNVAELEFYTTGTPPPPAAPLGLAATPGDGQVGLSWNAASGATSYNVKRSTTNGGPYAAIGNPGSTNYTDTTVVNGTLYYYVVSALGLGGEGTNSVQVSARPVSLAPLSMASLHDGGTLTLSWPADHTGWRLQSQTNTLATGLGTNWSDVPGSNQTNMLSAPVGSEVGSVFYRLIYP